MKTKESYFNIFFQITWEKKKYNLLKKSIIYKLFKYKWGA
jgi:hypothetical protein